MNKARRITVNLDSKLHRALRVKSAETSQSLSQLVNEAVGLALAQDREDLATLRNRNREPNRDFESVLKDLRRRGRL